jgi:hypothetical protein
MVSPFEIHRQPASISSSTFCGSSAFILQGVVSRVQPLSPTRGAVCPASDLVSESWWVPNLRFASAGWTPCRVLLPQEAVFLRPLPGAPRASSEVAVGQNRCTLRQASMPSSTAVQTGVAFERRGPERGTIEQTKTGRPTQVAQADGWRSFKRRRPLVVLASGSSGGLHGPLA